MIPQPVFPEGPVVFPSCDPEAQYGSYSTCHNIMGLLHSAERVPRKYLMSVPDQVSPWSSHKIPLPRMNFKTKSDVVRKSFGRADHQTVETVSTDSNHMSTATYMCAPLPPSLIQILIPIAPFEFENKYDFYSFPELK